MTTGRLWTEIEVERLRQLSRHFTAKQISRDIGRPVGAIHYKASQLRISLPRRVCNAPLPPPLRPTTVAECMSAWATVPRQLAELVVTRAGEAGVNLKELRSDRRKRELVRIRRDIAIEASSKFGLSEIGRALNRDHTTIRHHLFSCASLPRTTETLCDAERSD